MKSMRLTKLKKRSSNFFKKIGKVSPIEYSREEIRYITNRSYEALTKSEKKFIDNKEQIIETIVNQIMVAGEVADFNPYTMLKQFSEQQQMAKYPRLEFAKNVFRMFREYYNALYAKYNSYMYRLGYSGANYFYDNAKWSSIGSVVTATLILPEKFTGKVYTTLEITVDASDVDFIVASMD